MIKVKFNESMIVAAEKYVHSHDGRSGIIRAMIHDIEPCSEWRSNDLSQYHPAIDSYNIYQYSTDLVLCHELLVINDPESSHYYIVKYPYPNDIKIHKSHVVEIDKRELRQYRPEGLYGRYDKEFPVVKDNRDNSLWDDNLDNLFEDK